MNENNNSKTELNNVPNSKKEQKDVSSTEEKNNIIKKENIKIDAKEQIQAKAEVKKAPKPLPLEKKPFNEFINEHLIPELKTEFKNIGKEVINLNFSYGSRPIAGDEKWMIFCEVKETCRFWLSFESEDITSLKSFCLTKSTQNPSVLESFLIDERKITLKLIISRIFQRLNGQKLLGAN